MRLKVLVDIAKDELELGREINQVYHTLEEEMKMRWKLVYSTRRQYLNDINKILTNQYVLVI
ncbi:MAG: hypothetical protein OEM79_02160 [Nitrosopumilus sp.]|nr:hypothetical protein [Nitrosopumilus sp.]